MTFYIQKGQSSTSLWHHNVQVFFLNYCGRLQFPHHSTQFMFSSDAFLFFSCLFREAKLGTHLISCKSWFTISLPFTAFCLYLHIIFFTSLKHKAALWGFWGVFLFFFCLFAFSQFFYTIHKSKIYIKMGGGCWKHTVVMHLNALTWVVTQYIFMSI